jgi:hypothetical protein
MKRILLLASSDRPVPLPASFGPPAFIRRMALWAVALTFLIGVIGASAQQIPESSPSTGVQKPDPPPAPARQPDKKPASLSISGITVSGSLRGRIENWTWFAAAPGQSDYSFGAVLLRVSLGQKKEHFEWFFEGISPWLIHLPTQAVLPAPQGQLGLGGTYYAANHTQDGSAVFRQGFVKFKGIFGDKPSSIRVGRFEFSDGAEMAPKDATLAALKSDRIAQRLIGPFNFSHVGRGFDGLQFDRTTERNNFTLFAARPTEGVFQLRSLYELDVDLYYGAFTRQFPSKRAPQEARLFVLYYHDGRPILKTDNRPQAVRAADHHNIRITTLGGHYIAAFGSGAAKTDLLLWGVAQFGSWGILTQKSAAIAVEAGHKFAAPMQPWVRAGFFRSTGDSNPSDNKNSTFFQVLPTPRIYARFPFFNLMNNQDVFGELLLKPFKKLSLRADVHSLRLSNSHDLWYNGGGAYQAGTFGYTGRPSNGHADSGILWDGSLDYALTGRTTITFYGGVVRGGSVQAAIYPLGGSHPLSHLVYFEFLQRF